MIRLLVILILVLSLVFDVESQIQKGEIFLGKINGIAKDSFAKEEINSYPGIRIPKLTESPYDIEIRLYETDLIPPYTYCTIIYLDTIFKRKGFMNFGYEVDSTSKVENVSFSKLVSVDSIFNILIRNGIFSLEDLDPESFNGRFPNNYTPYFLNRNGALEKYYTTKVRDGVYYLLEFKVGSLFDWHSSFINPEAFYENYQDNQILRRQSKISSAITYGRQY